MSPNPKSKARAASLSLSRVSAGDAIKRGELKISDPIPIPREGDGFGPQALPSQQTETWPRRSVPVTEDVAVQGDSKHISDPRSYTDPRLSAYNTTASLSTHPSKSSLSKRQGGFRATMKRLFGGKKKRDTISSIVEEPSRREEPLSFITTADSVNEQRRAPRSSSMPIQDVTRHSALGSHAPDAFDTDQSATEKRTLQRNSYDGTYYLKRRNSLGDSGFGAREAMITNPKRRSRSADQLRQAALQGRNLNDEISFWRQSVADSPIPAHALSSPAITGVTGDPEEPGTAMSLLTLEQPKEDLEHTPTLHVMPSQTFDFGNLVNINAEDTLEQRLTTVEVKLMDLEMAMARLSGYDVGKPVVLEKPPPGRRVSQPARPQSGQSVDSSESPELTSLSSPQSSPSATDNEQTIPSMSDRMNRSSAATTVRPEPGARRSGGEAQSSERPPSYATIEHIEKLMILLQREQATRHKLELQVRTLENQMEQFQRSPPYSHFKVTSYPTPNSEDRSKASLRQLSGGGSFGRSRAGPESRFRDDLSVQTDTDDGQFDVYETPTEIKHHKLSIEHLRAAQPHMEGMI